MRCSSANKIRGTEARTLFDNCEMTPFRFFFDFFRCSTGDRDVTRKLVDDVMNRSIARSEPEGAMPAVLSLTVREG